MRTLHVVQRLYCFVITIGFFLFGNIAFGQTLTSDKGDYAPGETVTLTGSGFQAGETVTMQVLHYPDNGDNNTSDAHAPWDIMADGSGNFVTTWLVPADEDESGAILKATADGLLSGAHAETLFTDAEDQPPVCIEITPAGSDTTIQFPAVPVFTPPTAIDFCDSPVFIIVVSIDTMPGSITICWAATDNSGNFSDTVCQTITVVSDTTVQTCTATASNNGPLCAGDTLHLSSMGGTLPVNAVPLTATYSWTGPNGFTSSLQNPSISNVTTAAAGVYTVTITNSLGCSATATTTVVVHAKPSPVITRNSVGCSQVCNAVNSTLNAGAGYAHYLWSTGATTQTISVHSAGTYTVTVTNSSGCTGSASKTVTANTLPPPVITGCNSICSGSSTTFSAGYGYSSYIWSTGATTRSICVSTAGTYTVTVTNSAGCTAKASRTLTVHASPSPTITGNNSICSGSSTTLNAGAGYTSYRWSTGATTQTISVCTSGTYTVTVTNSSGCTGSATICVTVHASPNATAWSNSPVAVGGTLYLTSSGGTSYSWTGPNGFVSTLQNPSIYPVTNLNAGTYTVVVSNSYGCTASATTTVVVTLWRISDDPSIAGANNLKLYPNPSNGLFLIELDLNEPVRSEVNIQVLDLFGQIIYVNKTDVVDGVLRGEVKLDDNLPGGNYLIRVSSGEQVFSRQISYQK